MKKVQKVINYIFRYEMGFSLKNSGFSYLYGSISYLFGYENFGCFFLMRELAHCGERHRHACGSPSPPFQPAALANAQESPSLQGRRDRRNWSLNPELQDDLTILELHQLACVVLYACCSRGSEGVSKKNSFAIRQHVRVPCPLLLIYYRLTHH
jgi:hypothetical protein